MEEKQQAQTTEKSQEAQEPKAKQELPEPQRINTTLCSITENLAEVTKQLSEASDLLTTGKDGETLITKETLNKDEINKLLFKVEYAKMQTDIIKRQYHNENMAMLERAYNGAFYMPRTGINVANEFVKYGILVGLWQVRRRCRALRAS